jgi:hypothetical protein
VRPRHSSEKEKENPNDVNKYNQSSPSPLPPSPVWLGRSLAPLDAAANAAVAARRARGLLALGIAAVGNARARDADEPAVRDARGPEAKVALARAAAVVRRERDALVGPAGALAVGALVDAGVPRQIALALHLFNLGDIVPGLGRRKQARRAFVLGRRRHAAGRGRRNAENERKAEGRHGDADHFVF